LRDQFESVYSEDDGIKPFFENITQQVYSEEGIVLKSDIQARLSLCPGNYLQKVVG